MVSIVEKVQNELDVECFSDPILYLNHKRENSLADRNQLLPNVKVNCYKGLQFSVCKMFRCLGYVCIVGAKHKLYSKLF